MMRLRKLKWLFGGSLCCLIAWILTGYFAANKVTAPVPFHYRAFHHIDGYPVQKITVITRDHVKLNVWFSGSNKDSAVIFLHGIHANSVLMLNRAKIYLQKGYSVLIPDLRASGMSGGDAVTFGWKERLDLLACVQWLKDKKYRRIGVHGCSLGAAAIAYSLEEKSDYAFMVMESCYDNIDHAFANRTFDSGFNRLLFWPVFFFTERKTGATADQLSPLNCVHLYKGPLLYLAGDKEIQIPLEETHAMFQAFGSSVKQLRIFTGARHVDFQRFDPELYNKTLTGFLDSIKFLP